MSANIPETMPLSDLLKSTGYNCPEELQGKTFEEATSGGDTKVQTNKEATIDVSSYTEPVEIEPADEYDAMKKTTVTLTNIPGSDLDSNVAQTIDVSQYTEPVEINHTEGKDGMVKATVTLTNIPVAGVALYAWKAGGSVIYTKTATPDTSTHIYGPLSADGVSYFADATSDSFKIIEIVTHTLRVGSDAEHWAPYERNNTYDVTL